MPFYERLNNWIKTSLTLKLAIIGILLLLLMIPTLLIDELINDRRRLRDAAQDEVASKFGREQTFGGPVVSVPFSHNVTNYAADGKAIISTRTGYAHFLPEDLEIDGELVPEERHRGIFVVVLYNTQFTVTGHFDGFDAAALDVPEEALRWEDARFTVGISDMTGVDDEIMLNFKDSTLNLGPGTVTRDIFNSGANAPINLDGTEGRTEFSFAINLNGSSGLYFRPFGAKTTVNLESAWPDPSFDGTYLPQDYTSAETGFNANWEVLQLNRNYPQQGTGAFTPRFNNNNRAYPARVEDIEGPAATYGEDRFGVRLLLPVDEYSKIYRSTNYALLFIIITFLTFFFIEVLNKKRVHPIQYLLIGAAVILFYVLLLSISEHQYFDVAYWISALTITVLITAYSSTVLRNTRLTALVGGVLLILYAYFYSLLQLQDFALLVGSVGLLMILATIMYLTRNIDWYGLNGGGAE
ncbi:cell envelope integrity protein CreD [Neolewinella antarctica]|uniref:Inner membrane protein n=1 Tax=Neolewinella antarctica TaxID=442734 RepID=A0ABX0X9K5_9BACT|nr:cell envelope integrity protein CreD [Neolewinella antarctica]NJC25950.1 inner membrane protein [Neolewinella antarctica]